ADVARHAGEAGYVVVAHPHGVARLEALTIGDVAAARRARGGQRESTVRAPLELVGGDDALLDAQRRQAGQRALVVARAQVVARLHALDRVAVLVHVEDAQPHRQRI